ASFAMPAPSTLTAVGVPLPGCPPGARSPFAWPPSTLAGLSALAASGGGRALGRHAAFRLPPFGRRPGRCGGLAGYAPLRVLLSGSNLGRPLLVRRVFHPSGSLTPRGSLLLGLLPFGGGPVTALRLRRAQGTSGRRPSGRSLCFRRACLGDFPRTAF